MGNSISQIISSIVSQGVTINNLANSIGKELPTENVDDKDVKQKKKQNLRVLYEKYADGVLDVPYKYRLGDLVEHSSPDEYRSVMFRVVSKWQKYDSITLATKIFETVSTFGEVLSISVQDCCMVERCSDAATQQASAGHRLEFNKKHDKACIPGIVVTTTFVYPSSAMDMTRKMSSSVLMSGHREFIYRDDDDHCIFFDNRIVSNNHTDWGRTIWIRHRERYRGLLGNYTCTNTIGNITTFVYKYQTTARCIYQLMKKAGMSCGFVDSIRLG